tara:strand:- start:26656 stop:27552 length:897 start_codon:yes stop_codon:yes gene_type:complete
MLLPPLYKFLDPEGVKLTIGNGTFKHAKPSDFNDLEDLTVSSIFPGSLENAVREIQENFVDIVLENLDVAPTCSSPAREKLLLIQEVFRRSPEASRLLRKELAESYESLYDLDRLANVSLEFLKDFNDFMQWNRVLCVTTELTSDKMWAEYAGNFSGAAIRIQPNVQKDSKFQLFRPVTYREERPSLYETPSKFIRQSLFGNRDLGAKMAIEKVIYSKTLNWQHEHEYRLVVPVARDEAPWNTLSYHAEEIIELYLGARMTGQDRHTMTRLAKLRNPEIAIYQQVVGGVGALRFERIL